MNRNLTLFFLNSIAGMQPIKRLDPKNQDAKKALNNPSLKFQVTFEPFFDDTSSSTTKIVQIAPASNSRLNRIYYARIFNEDGYFIIGPETYAAMNTSLLEKTP